MNLMYKIIKLKLKVASYFEEECKMKELSNYFLT